MNSDLDQPWGNLPLPLPGIAAYFNRKKPMPEPTKSNADIILAGVHSCSLACNVIDHFDEVGVNVTTQSLVQAAREVLKYWGLTVTEVPQASSKPSAPLVDDAPPVPTPELRWPPLEPTLPAVYTENFYLVRDLPASDPMMTAKLETADPNPLTTAALSPGQQLSFLGTARWRSEQQCWLMRMAMVGAGVDVKLWVFSKALKPGDEVPKVIDATKMAGNADSE